MDPNNLIVSVTKDEMILNSYRATRREAGDLENLVAALKDSESHVKNTAYNKLDVIAEQIKFLQSQAKQILEKSAFDSRLHTVPCNFLKSPGQTYHIYERSTGEKFWSMVSPQEFGGNNKNEYIGSWRLESDKSFTKVEEIDEFTERRRFAEALMNNVQNVPAISFFNEANSTEPEKK